MKFNFLSGNSDAVIAIIIDSMKLLKRRFGIKWGIGCRQKRKIEYFKLREERKSIYKNLYCIYNEGIRI